MRQQQSSNNTNQLHCSLWPNPWKSNPEQWTYFGVSFLPFHSYRNIVLKEVNKKYDEARRKIMGKMVNQTDLTSIRMTFLKWFLSLKDRYYCTWSSSTKYQAQIHIQTIYAIACLVLQNTLHSLSLLRNLTRYESPISTYARIQLLKTLDLSETSETDPSRNTFKLYMNSYATHSALLSGYLCKLEHIHSTCIQESLAYCAHQIT